MKDSLKQKLFELIKCKGYVTYQEIVDYTNQLQYKIDNATRRLRELTDRTDDYEPMIAPVKNEKRIITGYKWIGTEKPHNVPKPIQTTLSGLNFASQRTYRNPYES